MQKRSGTTQQKQPSSGGKTTVVWSDRKAAALRKALKRQTAGYCNCDCNCGK